MRQPKLSLATGTLLLLPACFALPLSAAITGSIEANIPHSFTVAETTLPAGKYDLQMVPGSDLSVMRITSADGNESAEFLVRDTRADKAPLHAELIFDRYGNKEFLVKVFAPDKNLGVAVDEPSRAQLRLEKKGLHAVEHTETE